MMEQPLEYQIERTRRLGEIDPPALVTLTVTPQWAEVLNQLQKMRNENASAAVVQFRPLKVGCVIAFEDTRR